MDTIEVEKARANKIVYKILKIAASYIAMLIVLILAFGIHDMHTFALKIEHGLLCSLSVLMLLFLFLPKNYKFSLIIFCILLAVELFLLREHEWRSGITETIFGFLSLLVIIPFFETIIILLLSKTISSVNSKYLLYKNYSFLKLFARMFLVGIMIIFVMIISGMLRDALIDKFNLYDYIYSNKMH